jgi:hypothetical protein
MRFIINTGTRGFPHHSLVKGVELCPGGAETLLKVEGMYTSFDLKARRRALDQNAGFMCEASPTRYLCSKSLQCYGWDRRGMADRE